MMNFTLNITAVPELLAVISNLTNAISSSKVADTYSNEGTAVPEIDETNKNQAPLNVAITQNHTALNALVMKNQQANIPINSIQAPAQTSTVPTSTQNYTMEQLAVAATQLVDAGRRTELVALLNNFGVQALTALPKEQYGAFATQLRTLGAKI